MNSPSHYVVFLSDGSVVAHTVDVFGEHLRREVIVPAEVDCEDIGEPMVLVVLYCQTQAELH